MAPRSEESRRSGPPSGPKVIAVAVLSDDGAYRDALVEILSRQAQFSTTAVSASAPLAFGPRDVDVLLLDARREDALPLCATLSREGRTRILMVGAPDDDLWAAQALDAGARGIFTRDGDAPDLVMAIQFVHEGLIWARRRVITARIDQLATTISAAARSVNALEERLSMREREVFRYAATGLGNKQLARRLEISEATVKVHLTHIFQKLGVNGRAELAAAYHGIVQPPERPS